MSTDGCDDTVTSSQGDHWQAGNEPVGRDRLALCVAWSREEPHRIGEVGFLPEGDATVVLGRGGSEPSAGLERMVFFRQRPGQLERTKPLMGSQISRDQLQLTVEGEQVHVRSVGRCPTLIDGRVDESGRVSLGGTILLKNQLLLYVVKRSMKWSGSRVRHLCDAVSFGLADRYGMVGESLMLWRLREQLDFLAKRKAHVLILGESGSGKELAAKAIHGGSERSRRPMVARNAATLPPGLIDAELFGNIADYPNPGMAERRGLVGASDGSTLFLDEIGELGPEFQAHMLRILDTEGEYQRLGESFSRTSDFRLISATNRSVSHLKHDFAARMTFRVQVPGLNTRRSDIPLLLMHVLCLTGVEDPELADRFFDKGPGRKRVPRVDPALVERLMKHDYTHHVRELIRLCWIAIGSSTGNVIGLTDELSGALRDTESHGGREGRVTLDEVTPEHIQATLNANNGNQEKTWRELGLSSRHVLYRYMKKHAIHYVEE